MHLYEAKCNQISLCVCFKVKATALLTISCGSAEVLKIINVVLFNCKSGLPESEYMQP